MLLELIFLCMIMSENSDLFSFSEERENKFGSYISEDTKKAKEASRQLVYCILHWMTGSTQGLVDQASEQRYTENQPI